MMGIGWTDSFYSKRCLRAVQFIWEIHSKRLRAQRHDVAWTTCRKTFVLLAQQVYSIHRGPLLANIPPGLTAMFPMDPPRTGPILLKDRSSVLHQDSANGFCQNTRLIRINLKRIIQTMSVGILTEGLLISFSFLPGRHFARHLTVRHRKVYIFVQLPRHQVAEYMGCAAIMRQSARLKTFLI